MRFVLQQRQLRQVALNLGAFVFILTVAAALRAQVGTGSIVTRKYDFKEADKEMQYTLYVPKSYDKEKKSPLIVALHGLGSNPQQIIRYPGLTTHAEKHGYIVVAPMGYNSRGWYGSRGKGGGRGSDPRNLGELSEKDVMNVLAIIREEFSIDDQRIYLTRHSMGGGGTWSLAAEYPERFAAIVPICGGGRPSNADKLKDLPIWVFHGAKDKTVTLDKSQSMVDALEKIGGNVKFTIYPEAGHDAWTATYDNPALYEWMLKQSR